MYRIVELRQQKGLSQQELAKMLNTSKSFLGMIELHRQSASFNFVISICELFNVSANWLIFGLGSSDDALIKDAVSITCKECCTQHDKKVIIMKNTLLDSSTKEKLDSIIISELFRLVENDEELKLKVYKMLFKEKE